MGEMDMVSLIGLTSFVQRLENIGVSKAASTEASCDARHICWWTEKY